MALQLSGGAYDSDPGFSGEESRMRSFWRSLKRILHLPTVMKVRSPRAPRTNNQGHKKASFAKRFSMGALDQLLARTADPIDGRISLTITLSKTSQ